MILIRDVVDEFVAAVFDERTKDILEFIINNRKVTVKEQFLHHYKLACFEGTKEELISSFLYKLHLQEDLLLRINDLKTNINRIVELGEYSKVNLSYREQLGTETTIGATSSGSKSSNIQSDKYSGVDQSQNLNITDDRTAQSNTNVVEPLSTAIPQASIEASETPLQSKQFSINGEELEESNLQSSKFKLNSPQRENDPIGYQNYTKDLSTSETVNTNTTDSSRGSRNLGKNESNSSSTNVKGSRSDEQQRNVEYKTNEARLRLWKSQLPKLQLKFWNSFHSLFQYEQY